MPRKSSEKAAGIAKKTTQEIKTPRKTRGSRSANDGSDTESLPVEQKVRLRKATSKDATEVNIIENSSEKSVIVNSEASKDSVVLAKVTASATTTIKQVKATVVKKPKTASKRKIEIESDRDEEQAATETKAPKKRKTREEKEAASMPLASRTALPALTKSMYIGAHVSGAGGM